MILPPIGGRTWGQIPPDEQASRMARAAAMYGEGWDALPEAAKHGAAVLIDYVTDDEDPRLKTYACSVCLDVVYVVGRDNTAWFCTCPAGTRVEAADWFSRLYTRRGRKLIPNDSEKARFYSYLRQRPNGVELRDAVNRLLDLEEAKPMTEGA